MELHVRQDDGTVQVAAEFVVTSGSLQEDSQICFGDKLIIKPTVTVSLMEGGRMGKGFY